ncbi:phage tail fiber protein, partial [Gilliamella sp. Nev3-1]
ATLVKKSGDEMTGTLRINDGDKSAIQLQNAAGQIWQQRTFADGSFCLERYNSVLNQWIRFLRYVEPENSWKFENIDDVTINNKSVLKSGDYGVGAVVGAIAENFDGHLAGGFYQCSTSDFSDLQFTGDSAATLLTYPSNSKSWKVEQLSVVSSKTPKIYYRCDTRDGKQKWYEAITTANSTVDSNGFLKKASPILRLFATENIDDVDDFKKSGCSLVNDLAAGVTAKRIDIGHYEISGSLGFAKEGWYITLPEDANGNKKFFAEYSTDENNIITVKTYTRKFDFESCQIVAGEPIDITEGRWIDIRLEMPVVEVIENEEPIPSTLNPVIINNDEN